MDSDVHTNESQICYILDLKRSPPNLGKACLGTISSPKAKRHLDIKHQTEEGTQQRNRKAQHGVRDPDHGLR